MARYRRGGKETKQLKPQDKQILKVLLEHDYWLSTTEVANLSHISWNTAKKHLDKLLEFNWINKREVGNREDWRGFRK